MLPAAFACVLDLLILASQETFATTAARSEELRPVLDRLGRALAGPVIEPSFARAARRRLCQIARGTCATRTNLLRARLDLLSQRAEAIQDVILRLRPTPAGDVIRVREVLEGVSRLEREWLEESLRGLDLLQRE